MFLSACNSGGGSSAPEAPITYLPAGVYSGFTKNSAGESYCNTLTLNLDVQSSGLSEKTSWTIKKDNVTLSSFDTDLTLTNNPCMTDKLVSTENSNIDIDMSSCSFSNNSLNGILTIFGIDYDIAVNCSFKLSAVKQ